MAKTVSSNLLGGICVHLKSVKKAWVRLIYPNQIHDSKSGFQNHKHDPATLQTLCFNSMIL